MISIEEFEANKELISDEIQRKRAKHAVYENQRTITAVQALKDGKIEEFGKLMNQSHISCGMIMLFPAMRSIFLLILPGRSPVFSVPVSQEADLVDVLSAS